MRAAMFMGLLAIAGLAPVSAHDAVRDPSRATSDIRDMEAVVVTGVRPGPGMWKVSKGDHVLWVLGVQSPLSKKMEWVSRDVEGVLAQTQEVIWGPAVGVQVKAGFFEGAMLLPRLFGLRKNPDGRSLQEVVPADMYLHWLSLKAKYIDSDDGIEQWRPIFAASKLWDEAIDDSGLTESGVVSAVIKRAAKQHAFKQTHPQSYLVITDAKVALKEFKAAPLGDLDCFGKTMQRLETDLDAMRLRANAWAVGDLGALRALPYGDQHEACARAMMQAGVVRTRLDRDLDAELAQRWLEAVEKALTENAVTFAMLPMGEALKPDGYLAKLQAKGYVIQAPQ